ncbi:MAG TPA: single-stranded-DNA-specific exonuclease RecJ [Candidatus Woesebacteria bacterium]|nr:single-stranded-DNA-specific exonuclease RecJ [Candidatus Woesebacteria bacterium]
MKITFKQEITTKNIKPKELIEILLKNRNVTDPSLFLKPPSPLDLTLKDFGYNKEIEKTMKILKEIKSSGKTIVVYTDYDADGITGGSILWETLHLLGFNVMPYVPHRQHEGYGFSEKGINNVKEKYDPALIISVDHGITAVNQIKYAKSIGIPVIVTDHHHKQEKIPEDAVAIFHIPTLSGSGVAYFFAKEVYKSLRSRQVGSGNPKEIASSSLTPRNDQLLQENFRTDYLSLASIGTIADLVPLVGPSRSVVTYGLKAFPFVKRVGIQQIIKEAGIENKLITPFEVGFVIAPRINAVGRLEHAIDAMRLLCTTSRNKAVELAGKVGIKNTERKDLVKRNVEQAKNILLEKEKTGELDNILILHSKDWHEGVIGLIASNILETYYRPVIVMTQADGFFKGSARSIPSFHITHFFEELKEYFMNFGGHAGAAGFTLPAEKLEAFIKEATKKANKQIKKKDLIREMEVDIKLPISAINMQLAKQMESLQPFGIGNPTPSFLSDVIVQKSELFGKTQDHLKIIVKDVNGDGFPLELIAFGKADLFTQLSRGQKTQVVYQVDINRWNGRESLRGRLLHIEI